MCHRVIIECDGVAKGKADKANTTAFEQRVADMKAGKL